MHRLALTLMCVGAVAIRPDRLEGQVADPGVSDLRELIESLPPSTRIRVGSQGSRWAGRLSARGPDSLAIASETGIHTLHLAAIDSLWVRGGRHHGLLAGAAFGAMMFGLLRLNDSAEPTDDRLGLILFVGATTAGLLVDAASERWAQRYPQ